MSIRTDQGTAGIFRCRRCNVSTYAVTANTWFYDMNNKVMLAKGLLLTYSFSMGFSYQQVIRETTIISTGEKRVIKLADWFSYCRQDFMEIDIIVLISNAVGFFNVGLF